MRYRARVIPLYAGHRQEAKATWAYTDAASIMQAGRFLRIRYPYPQYVVEEPIPDPRAVRRAPRRGVLWSSRAHIADVKDVAAGTKPAGLVDDAAAEEARKLGLDTVKVPTGAFSILEKRLAWVVVPKGKAGNAKAVLDILERYPISAEPRPPMYHVEMGRAMGYSENDIAYFIEKNFGVEVVDTIFLPKAVPTPAPEVAGRFLYKGSGVWEPSGGVGGTWLTSDLSYARTFGAKVSFTEMPDRIKVFRTQEDFLAEIGKTPGEVSTRNDYLFLKDRLEKEGYEGLSKPSNIAKADEVWLFERPILKDIGAIPKAEAVVPPTAPAVAISKAKAVPGKTESMSSNPGDVRDFYKDIEYGRTKRGSLISRTGETAHLEITNHEDMIIAGKLLESLRYKGIPYSMEHKEVYSPKDRKYVSARVIEFPYSEYMKEPILGLPAYSTDPGKTEISYTITDPGKTVFHVGNVISEEVLFDENERVIRLGEIPAIGKRRSEQ